MRSPVYIKMDARNQLLLAEGVCRQLGIISYHSDVEKWRGCKTPSADVPADQQAKVPTVRVWLVGSVNHQSEVQVDASKDSTREPLLLETENGNLEPCQHKLSRPWHGPYHVVSRDDPGLLPPGEADPETPTPCPPSGYYWYRNKRQGHHRSGSRRCWRTRMLQWKTLC